MAKLLILIVSHAVVPVPESIDVSRYDVSMDNMVIVWCESVGRFISAARYSE